MKKKEKKKIFELYSNNEEVSNLINKMKSSSKTYLKIISVLQVLGNFDGKTEIETYDIVDTEKERKIRLWCSDNDNLFIMPYLMIKKTC